MRAISFGSSAYAHFIQCRKWTVCNLWQINSRTGVFVAYTQMDYIIRCNSICNLWISWVACCDVNYINFMDLVIIIVSIIERWLFWEENKIKNRVSACISTERKYRTFCYRLVTLTSIRSGLHVWILRWINFYNRP